MSGLDDPLQYKKHFQQHLGLRHQNNEIQLYDNAEAEVFAITGIPVDYYPVEINENSNLIFGEDNSKRFLRKVKLTCIIDDDAIKEQLIYSNFGELLNVEFRIYLHTMTFMKQIQREPVPGDQMFLNFNSKVVYEITHVHESSLGLDGNFFGFRSIFACNVKQRQATAMDVGYGERYGVLDSQGNLRSDAPADALVNDGSGRVKDKYNVPQPQTSSSQYADNDYIEKVVDGTVNPSTGVQEGGISLPANPEHRERWQDW